MLHLFESRAEVRHLGAPLPGPRRCRYPRDAATASVIRPPSECARCLRSHVVFVELHDRIRALATTTPVTASPEPLPSPVARGPAARARSWVEGGPFITKPGDSRSSHGAATKRLLLQRERGARGAICAARYAGIHHRGAEDTARQSRNQTDSPAGSSSGRFALQGTSHSPQAPPAAAGHRCRKRHLTQNRRRRVRVNSAAARHQASTGKTMILNELSSFNAADANFEPRRLSQQRLRGTEGTEITTPGGGFRASRRPH